jgi:N-sulfoglucosamine sulfohydrolase
VKRFLTLLLPAVLLPGALCSLIGQAAAAPKNVVLIVADDLFVDLGCYGNQAIKTPHIDALAREGTRFTHAFCTTASCSPSRSVLLTGMHNHANGQYGLEHGVNHFQSLDNVKSLPARLAKAHYRTARIGKFHVGPLAVYPFEQALAGDGRNGVQMAERCRELISAADSRPFFLYFCTDEPHRGGGTGPAPAKANRFGNEKSHEGVEEVHYDPRDVIVPRYLPNTPTCRAELAEYYQSVSRLDQGIGRLVKVLKDAGHWDDTLIVFVSDNGIPFPGAKTTVYDPGINLPCIVRDPGAKQRGVNSNAMISWVDIAPTILEYAGLESQGKNLHGHSLLNLWLGHETEPRDEVYASHQLHEITMYYPMRMVRTRKHKLIWNIAHPLPFPFASDLWYASTWQEAWAAGPDTLWGQRKISAYVQRPKFELYDLEKDPDELVNLAADPASAPVLAELKEKIKKFQQRTGDPWILKWDYE